jgi:hypothetical protein
MIILRSQFVILFIDEKRGYLLTYFKLSIYARCSVSQASVQSSKL